MNAINGTLPDINDGVVGHLKDLAVRYNLLGAVTYLQGLITLGISWMILFRSETAELTANEHKTHLLTKVSESHIVRLKAVKDRLIDAGGKTTGPAPETESMLRDLEIAIIDYKEILDYCVDLELRTVFWRYRNSRKIAIELQEKEARATDPTHLLNLTLSGVFTLLSRTAEKPLVDI
ncbi:hypothetical protein FRB94_001588 [Tulasnella sp. JGI-2019a]|nr:hypothetical protein FRB93_003314 [Tulasnella sp. JGI-2019a]KAG9005364.1 hypothetical protein FRB94_001588 [Tulasnella sp. JGI-2019a]KAG9032813.1 hypothetical protein FRB95_000979 [Tulasnella sp. JGI-2019a]